MSKRALVLVYLLAHLVKSLYFCWISAYMQMVTGANTSVTESGQKRKKPGSEAG